MDPQAAAAVPLGAPAPSMKAAVKHHITSNPKAVAVILAVMALVILVLVIMLVSCKSKEKKSGMSSYNRPAHKQTTVGTSNVLSAGNNPLSFLGNEAAGGLLDHPGTEGASSTSQLAAASGEHGNYTWAHDINRVPTLLGSKCGGAPDPDAVAELQTLVNMESPIQFSRQ